MQCMEVKLGTRVFQRFHDNHEQKMASGTFAITTSSFLKLAHHTMHGSETWYAYHFHDNHEQKWPWALFDQERLLHFSNLQTIQCKKVTLRMHVHFSISMATMNQKWPQALFYITTSSLLKLANYTMHEGKTDFSVSMRAMTKNSLGNFSL